MPNYAINGLTAPDQYTKASTIDGGSWFDHINLDIVNQAVFWRVKQASRPTDTPQMAVWQAEVQMLPGSRVIDRPGLCGIQFRAKIPAASLPAGSTQAVVTVEAVS